MLDPSTLDLSMYRHILNELAISLKVDDVRTQAAEIEAQSAVASFWDDPTEAQATMQKLNSLKQSIAPWEQVKQQLDDLEATAELLKEDEDDDLAAEFAEQTERLKSDIDTLEIDTLLSGEHDEGNAIMEINAGAGGTESCDWAEMLMRMYLRWAATRGFKTELLDHNPGDVAGIKSATIRIEGRNAYGYSHGESGVHRLVRISPFDSNARRHTSFASVDVVPELEEAEVDINPDDLKLETFRASTAGGQHMQKNETAVRITHIPTNTVVTCQNERSQGQNRLLAMKVLSARLAERERRLNLEKINALRGDTAPIEWGHQIRSYVFQPYYMVKDHRTDAESGNVPAIMDGDIDLFIHAYLKWKKAKDN